MIDPRKLEIIPGSEFNTTMCPIDILDENYAQAHDSTLEFHKKVTGKSKEELLTLWKDSPAQKIAWDNFTNYLARYHTTQDKRNIFTAPLCAGYNILQFDWYIIERLSAKYNQLGKDGRTTLFFSRDKLDVMFYCFSWFEDLNEPSGYSLDALREFFGIETAGSHDALKDVKDTAEILIRFLHLHRRTAKRVKFKDSFRPAKVALPTEESIMVQHE
jgi:DNA polymerase III epsilon subunit-like protein